MSDPSIPDFYRRGDDLIARIDELAKARSLDPEMLWPSSDQRGDGWIYLLLACRQQLLVLDGWKTIAKAMTNVADVVNSIAKTQSQINELVNAIADASGPRVSP